jgi:hypothetical protein
MAEPECPGCRVLKRRVAELEALVRDLRARLGTNACNSALPPPQARQQQAHRPAWPRLRLVPDACVAFEKDDCTNPHRERDRDLDLGGFGTRRDTYNLTAEGVREKSCARGSRCGMSKRGVVPHHDSGSRS